MPEIYICAQNLNYLFKALAKEDCNFTKQLKELEFRFAVDMEQNRLKLFGY